MPSLSEETDGRVERLMPGATIGIIGGAWPYDGTVRTIYGLQDRGARPHPRLSDRAGG